MSGTWIAAGGAAFLIAAFGLLALAAHAALARERRLVRLGRELDDLLQVSESPGESHNLLIAHAERIVGGGGAAVLRPGAPDDRIEPTMAPNRDETPLKAIQTERLPARSCLALRMGRSHVQLPDEPALALCEVCGAVDGSTVCEPLTAGGEAIGALLVAAERSINDRQQTALRDAARRAAPVLAHQHRLELAVERAMVDPLTGLPNRQAADQALIRMAAQAGRSLSPLSAVLFDLDHFTPINALHGADHGDRALAEIGRVISEMTRGSDFGARFGGDKFLLLLPDTDRNGAFTLAQKIRIRIEGDQSGALRHLTASFGVASLPEDALDAERLLLRAERALGAAKALGRNRLQAAESHGLGGLTEHQEPGGNR